MNRYIIFGTGGALAVGLLGYSIWLGAVIGLALAILTTPPNRSKRVIIEDVQTGKIEIQPDDAATRRYINGRSN